ncbi:gamma-glutamyl-gamma-aminobutyrate hydrolase family protein [Arthrobacter sp. GCM10027362]|uniref:gamma-glutamyl-gamma-aminobutyrate hydrolase family protein n=1 Tax=Arthrobacter sp. GCM10027362 TaxID=3273379 RepID=UPI0036324611
MSSNAPLILVVADRKSVTTGAWANIPNNALPHTYVQAVEQAGGMPVLLPPTDMLLANAERLLDMADGVFLAGGRDLDAALYGRENHPLNDTPLRIRDDLEIALARGARDRGMPVLGACRGMQVLNVAFGGTLEQHLGDRLDMTPHRDTVGEFTSHPVTVVPDTRLAGILGPCSFPIAAHHHQAVDTLGEGLVATAYADDGVVEALEAPDDTFLLGVQWHPEERLDPEGLQLLTAFVDAAGRYRAEAKTAEAALHP